MTPGPDAPAPADAAFDDIAAVALSLCDAAAALVGLVDGDRLWFRGRAGPDAPDLPALEALCRPVLRQPDLRGAVAGWGFYAGVPVLAGGVAVGVLCVLDRAPRPDGLGASRLGALQALARQAARLLHPHAPQDRGTWLRSAIEAGNVGTFEVEVATGEIAVSPEFCRIFGLAEAATHPAAAIEALVVPADRLLQSNQGSRLDGSAALNVDYRIRRADDGRLRWIARRARFRHEGEGRPAQMFGTVRDVTEEKLTAIRGSALMELGDQLRDALSVVEATDVAARLLGETLAVARAGYAAIDVRGGWFEVESDWAVPGTGSLVGRASLAPFPATIARLTQGEAIVEADIAGADWLQDERPGYFAMSTRSMVKVPLLAQGRLEAVVFLHDPAPRHWSAEELAFVRSVADRTYAAVAKLGAEERQQTLNQEISHRLKNTMSMVQAIASQTLRAVADRPAVDMFERRLQALSKAHDLLMQQSWASADIGALVQQVLRTAGQEERARIYGPPIELGSRAVLSLSLVLHELATNAAKYGALSTPAGQVEVAWRIETEGGEAMLEFTWQESGGPAVTEPTRRGFGSRLIRAGLVGNGGVVARYEPSGFVVEMKIPLSQAIQ